MADKRGRGRLSSIDLLPAEADEIVTWAACELRERERTQADIGAEFNDKLAEIGLGPISPSAFNRHAIRMADMLRRINQTREIAAVLTDRLEPGQSDKVTLTLAEMIKSLISELLDNGGEAGFTPKQAMELASAMKSIVAAEKMSTERQKKLETNMIAKMDKAIDAAGEKMAEEGKPIDGLEILKINIRQDVYGIYDQQPEK